MLIFSSTVTLINNIKILHMKINSLSTLLNNAIRKRIYRLKVRNNTNLCIVLNTQYQLN